jgi:hypothetical protein
MRRLQVVVLYVHALFGQGIGKLLSSDKGLEVTCLPAEDESSCIELRRLRPRVIFVEAPDEGCVWRALGDLAPSIVIRVCLDDQRMDVYYGHKTLPAGPEDLIEAIHSGLRHRWF